MKNITSNQHGGPSNCPIDGDVFSKMLEAMTTKELTDGLNEALESMTDENYDPALIDAYLAALDRKDPMPEVPDAEGFFADFQNKLLLAFPSQSDKATITRHKVRAVWRTGLIAALTAVCLMSGMVVAQAAGLDVFGAIAHWTDAVFSLGAIHSDGATDEPSSFPLESNASSVDTTTDHASLQEALDDYGITEFAEPTWLPDGYEFQNVVVDYWPDDNRFIALSCSYSNGADTLLIDIAYHQDEQPEQLQKTDTPIESFTAGGLTVYLLENINSNSAAWVTEHYECYISGTVERQVLKQIVLSSYAYIQ